MTPLERLAGEVDGRLDVVADLAVAVDGASMHLRGQGSRLVLDVDDPSALRTSASTVDLRAVARTLEQLGLHLRVQSPRGTVADIGAGVTGPAASLLGAPVRPGAATTSLVPARVRAGVVAVLVAVAAWVAARLRRRNP